MAELPLIYKEKKGAIKTKGIRTAKLEDIVKDLRTYWKDIYPTGHTYSRNKDIALPTEIQKRPLKCQWATVG